MEIENFPGLVSPPVPAASCHRLHVSRGDGSPAQLSSLLWKRTAAIPVQVAPMSLGFSYSPCTSWIKTSSVSVAFPHLDYLSPSSVQPPQNSRDVCLLWHTPETSVSVTHSRDFFLPWSSSSPPLWRWLLGIPSRHHTPKSPWKKNSLFLIYYDANDLKINKWCTFLLN